MTSAAGAGAPRAGAPTTEAIVEQLASEVALMRPGDRVPSETEIMSRFRIARSRARQVLTTLESNHLVQRRQGSGTFVSRVYDYVVSEAGPASLHQTISQLGGEVRSVTIDVRREVAPDWVCRALGVDPGSAMPVLTRLAYIDDHPAVHLREYVMPGLLDEVGVALTVIESVEEILQVARHMPYRARCRGSLELPPAAVAQVMGLPPAHQAWRLTSLLLDRRTDAPLIVSDNHSRLDVLRMVFAFGSGAAADLAPSTNRPANG